MRHIARALTDAVSDLWAASVAQVYDEWRGWYQVVELVDGKYHPRRVLTRAEALAWQNPDPAHFALDVKHVISKGINHADG